MAVHTPSPMTAHADCSNPTPVFDGLGALAMLSFAVAQSTDSSSEMQGAAAIPAVVALVFAVSGVYGYAKVSACSDERDALARRGSGAH